MGRSPLFEEQVRFCPFLSVPGLEALRDVRPDMHIRIEEIVAENKLSTPCMLRLERSCSTYGLQELYLPVPGEVYQIVDIEHYDFGSFRYDMIAIRPPKNMMATFLIRSDGVLMNIENLEPRGYISRMTIV